MTVHAALDLDDTQKADLGRIARHEEMTVDALMTNLAKERLAYDAWFRAEVQKGLDSVARGETISHEEAVRGLGREWRA